MSSHRLRLVATVCFVVGGIPWWLYQLDVVTNQDAMPWLIALYDPTLAAGLVCLFIFGSRWMFRVTRPWFERRLFLAPWLVRGAFLLALAVVEAYCFLIGLLSMSYVSN